MFSLMRASLVLCVAGLLSLSVALPDNTCAALNNCSQHGQCRSGLCVCHAGYGGEDCSGVTTDCPNHCYGHGSCLNGTCSCTTGFAGSSCDVVTEVCPFNCSGNGICQNGRCFCQGSWTGISCNEELFNCPSNLRNCTGHGRCKPTSPQSSEWACVCDEGFCGDACHVVCGKCDNNCTGHGVCDGRTCICDIGFTGTDCSQVLPACPKNCSGNGHCQRPTNATATIVPLRCSCIDGYSGIACDVNTRLNQCPMNCSGKGRCSDSGCVCLSGFAGAACEKAYGQCELTNRCSGNGLCVNGTCHCYPGFSGFDCAVACRTHYNGSVGCHADKKRGMCVNGTCVCKPEWGGMWCDEDNIKGLLDGYHTGWKPLGTIVMCAVAVAIVAMLAGFVAYRVSGSKGSDAVPGVSSLRSQVVGVEYPEQPPVAYPAVD